VRETGHDHGGCGRPEQPNDSNPRNLGGSSKQEQGPRDEEGQNEERHQTVLRDPPVLPHWAPPSILARRQMSRSGSESNGTGSSELGEGLLASFAKYQRRGDDACTYGQHRKSNQKDGYGDRVPFP